MKAVAAALVLIAGAAVVLWYGNTLSSWVLGGLIGGLAALLLSIPISLTLFSYFSRRHDARMRAEAEEEKALARMYSYTDAETPARTVRPVYEYDYEAMESYMLPPAEPAPAEEDYRRGQPARNLPVPSRTQLPVSQRGRPSPPAAKRQTKSVPLVDHKDVSGRRTTARRMNYPGFPGYEPASSLAQHRSAALRVARQEAAQQSNEEIAIIPPGSRRSQFSRRPSRSLEQPEVQQNRYRSRRTIDSTPSRNGEPRSLPPAGESTASRRSSRRYDPGTDYLEGESYPQTEGLSQAQYPGYPSRRSQYERVSEPLDPTTDNLQRPLVRRAPYTYEDDPLRQAFARQVDAPAIRRSSRYLLDQQQGDEDEDYS